MEKLRGEEDPFTNPEELAATIAATDRQLAARQDLMRAAGGGSNRGGGGGSRRGSRRGRSHRSGSRRSTGSGSIADSFHTGTLDIGDAIWVSLSLCSLFVLASLSAVCCVSVSSQRYIADVIRLLRSFFFFAPGG